MSLFSNGNTKVRPRRPRTAGELGRAKSPPELAKPRQLQRRALELNKEIHRLECLIADAPRLQKQRRLETLDELPPLETGSPRARRKKLSMAQRGQVTSRRIMLAVEWCLVLGGFMAVTGWLNQWFHFLPR
jgi:hypothetical protein